MKFVIVFVALFAVAFAYPNKVETVRQDSEVLPKGFKFGVETSDGTQHDAFGELKKVDEKHDAIVVHGAFSYKDEKTGQVYTVKYVADEKGFQPEGAHLPQAPEHKEYEKHH